jgi:hypothetical protein
MIAKNHSECGVKNVACILKKCGKNIEGEKGFLYFPKPQIIFLSFRSFYLWPEFRRDA